MTATLRGAERRLVRAVEGMVDGPRTPPAGLRLLGAFYLRHRHLALHRAIRAGWVWVPSAWRLAIALGVAPGDRVLDLGANLGRVSQEAAWRVGRRGRVDAFEPSPAVADRLERRMERLGLAGRVAVHRCAVGARAGTAMLYEYAHRDGGASSLRPQSHVGVPPEAERPVPVIAVDGWLAEERRDAGGAPPPPRLVKIDVEGAEVEALEGARSTLGGPGPRPLLVVEAAPVTQRGFGRGVQPLLDVLHDLGYEPHACRHHGLAPVRREEDLPPRRRREDLLALHPRDHGPLARHLEGLARRRAR